MASESSSRTIILSERSALENEEPFNGPTSAEPENAESKSELWAHYLKLAGEVDQRLVEDWAKIVDVILVYIALFISVLTAFIIETTRTFQPNPGDVTNQILIAIYNQTMNASHPINLEKYLRLDENSHNNAVYRNLVLYSSLSFAIVFAALATTSRIWIIRYNREVTPGPGPPRFYAMRRQEAYDGSRSWKLGVFIESLPGMTLVAVVIFGLFILSSISENSPSIGYVVGNIFQLGLAYFSIASLSGAFTSNAPFRSSFSDFISFVFRNLPNHPLSLCGVVVIRLRTVIIILTSLGVLSGTAFRVVHYHPDFMGLIYYPIAGMFALMKKGEERDIPPRRCTLPCFLLWSCLVIFAVYALSMYYAGHPRIFYGCFASATLLLAICAWILVKMSETTPVTTGVEAVAWLLNVSPSPNPDWFQEAFDIAGDSHYSRALLLERLLPLAEPLIVLVSGQEAQGTTRLQTAYLDCLEKLTNFQPSKANFWHNEAPIPSKHLRRKLAELTSVECPQVGDPVKYPRHRAEKCPRCRVKRISEDALKRFEGGVDIVQVRQRKWGKSKRCISLS